MPRVAHDIAAPADLNETAAWWLNSPPANSEERLRERCEEHITFTSHDDSHVRVVGQIRLPDAYEASLPHIGRERLFLIPYFWLGKGESRTSHYVIKGIDGCPVPIYTRAANVAITADVFEKFAARTLRCSRGLVRDVVPSEKLRPATGSQAPDITLASLLHRLAAGGLVQSRFSLQLIVNMLDAENGADDGGLLNDLKTGLYVKAGERERHQEELRRYKRLLRDIAAGEVLWVPLLGRPGTQVRLELSYTARAKKPPIFRQKTRKRIVTLRCAQDKRSVAKPAQSAQERVSTLEPPHRTRMTIDGQNLRMRSTTRRVWNYFAHVFGYAPYETLFSAGAMRRWSSYHLHVSAPPGVEIRGAQLLTRLQWETGHYGHVRTEISAERAHLVISKAQFTAQAQLPDPLPVRIRMRSADRHTVWFGAGMAWLVAVMLWLFATAKAGAITKHDSAVSEILVIVPALLLTFAGRPGEHGFASRVLVGVRMLMLISGTCCVAAAVVLSREIWGKRQQGLLHHLLIVDAGLATLIAGLLSLTVLLTVRWLDTPRLWLDRRFDNGRLAEEDRKGSVGERRPDRGGARYWNFARGLFVSQLAFVALLFGLGPAVTFLAVFGCFILPLAFLGAVLAARGESVRTKPPGAAALLGLTATLATGAFTTSVIARVTHTHIPQEWFEFFAIAALPAAIDLLSRMSHFQLTGQPGYDFALRQTEGDFEERPELDERLGMLIEAIFGPPIKQSGRLERINPFRPDKETVYVDLVSGDLAPPHQSSV